MDFKQLRSFVAVADCGSFTQAAAQLYTSQPTISAHQILFHHPVQIPIIQNTDARGALWPSGHRLH